ncbi:hypothetical protein [Nannocystis pusilla]|uniref:hypothetical protein n=1 Tax=Nannocystis pusilla TaxID=889268 RepID=UPI003B812889
MVGPTVVEVVEVGRVVIESTPSVVLVPSLSLAVPPSVEVPLPVGVSVDTVVDGFTVELVVGKVAEAESRRPPSSLHAASGSATPRVSKLRVVQTMTSAIPRARAIGDGVAARVTHGARTRAVWMTRLQHALVLRSTTAKPPVR